LYTTKVMIIYIQEVRTVGRWSVSPHYSLN